MRNEAYFSYAARTNDEYNAADERFRAACTLLALQGLHYTGHNILNLR